MKRIIQPVQLSVQNHPHHTFRFIQKLFNQKTTCYISTHVLNGVTVHTRLCDTFAIYLIIYIVERTSSTFNTPCNGAIVFLYAPMLNSHDFHLYNKRLCFLFPFEFVRCTIPVQFGADNTTSSQVNNQVPSALPSAPWCCLRISVPGHLIVRVVEFNSKYCQLSTLATSLSTMFLFTNKTFPSSQRWTRLYINSSLSFLFFTTSDCGHLFFFRVHCCPMSSGFVETRSAALVRSNIYLSHSTWAGCSSSQYDH